MGDKFTSRVGVFNSETSESHPNLTQKELAERCGLK